MFKWIGKRSFEEQVINPSLSLGQNIEEQAEMEFDNCKSELENCNKCKIQPAHNYDAFGMPIHKLQCPKCRQGVEVAKSWEKVQTQWNVLQIKGVSEFIIGAFTGGELGDYETSYAEKVYLIRSRAKQKVFK